MLKIYFSSKDWNLKKDPSWLTIYKMWLLEGDTILQCSFWTCVSHNAAKFVLVLELYIRLCGPAVRDPGYRSRDPGLDLRRYHIFCEIVGLERGPLSLVRITEELLEWKGSGFGSRKSRLTAVGMHYADNATSSIHKIDTNFADMWRLLGRYS
jgi:hypothetical protein